MVDPLYAVTVRCVICEVPFQTMKVRPSFKKSVKTDTDFCVHYKDFNPDYYVVRVCPACGYASTENSGTVLSPFQKEQFREKIGNRWAMKDYRGERSWEDALATYKLALVCAQLKSEKDRVVAGLLHHIAWLYRYREDKEQEDRFLRYALERYIAVFEYEGLDVNNAKLMYLIGELSRRTGDFKEAVRWYGRVINDKSITDPGMIRACKEQWSAAREEMIEKRMELPEEMKLQG